MDYIQHVVETIVVRTENINGMIIKECFYKSTCSAALIACWWNSTRQRQYYDATRA